MTTVNTGITQIDLGAFPGTGEATVDVTGQRDIPAGAICQAWLRPVATVDHTADEHALERLIITAGPSVAGVGFPIRIASTHRGQYGKWSLAWSWQEQSR